MPGISIEITQLITLVTNVIFRRDSPGQKIDVLETTGDIGGILDQVEQE